MDRRRALKGLGLSLGYIVATPTIISMLESCKTDETQWEPIFLTINEGFVLKSIIDLILPKTDATPGALEVNVPEFLDLYASKVFGDEEKRKFKDGLSAILQELNVSQNNPTKLKTEKYDALLAKYLKASKVELEEINNNVQNTLVLNSLIEIRSSAIWAFKTSEEVGKNVLAYDPIPGVQIGCMPLEKATGGKAWSL